MKLNNAPKRNYLKSDDVKQDDIITIQDAGVQEESQKFTYPDGNPKIDYVFKITHGGEEKYMRFNKYSRDALILSYGLDTETWIGKTAKVTIELVRSLNKNMIILSPTEKAKPETVNPEDIEWDKDE